MSFYTFNFKPRPVLFVSTVIAMLVYLAAVVWFAQFYFIRTGDLISENEIVRIQRAAKKLCLYDTRATNNHAAYKLALYRQVKPQVVTIGSSRMLQFGAPMFDASFVNLGRTMNTLAAGPNVLAKLVQHGKPDLVLIGLDFWWFNPNDLAGRWPAQRPTEVQYNNPGMLKSLIENSIANPEFWNYVGDVFQPTTCHLGVAAKTFLSGFGPDGFRYYGEILHRKPKVHKDYQFTDTLRRIDKGNRQFQYATEPDSQSIDQFVSFIDSFKSQGMEVIVLVLPVAPTIAAAMKNKGKYDYVAKTMDELRQQGIMFFDFYNPVKIGLEDCDFLDGFHPGDVASARMLANMARSHPKLDKMLNHNEVTRLSKLRSRAAVYFSEAFGIKETDFLGIGCRKSS